MFNGFQEIQRGKQAKSALELKTMPEPSKDCALVTAPQSTEPTSNEKHKV